MYFDTNAHFDVFERRRPELFPIISALANMSRIQIVASEVGFTEIFEGSHLPSFDAGLRDFLAVRPKWIYLTGMTAREVIFAYDPQFRTPDGSPGTLLDWTEFIRKISEPADLATIRDLTVPTEEALHAFLPPGIVAESLKYWKQQLKVRQAGVRRFLASGSKDDVFRRMVASIVRLNIEDASDFANDLLANADQAPAFRLQFELDVLTVNTTKPKWLKNDFFDFMHAGVLPHVDIFVTRDETFTERLAWYDANVRSPQGLTPYMMKVCRDWRATLVRLNDR